MVFLFLSICHLHVSQEICEKSIPILPGTLARSGGVFSRKERVQQYVPQVLVKYVAQLLSTNS